jgi:hypothetical protein
LKDVCSACSHNPLNIDMFFLKRESRANPIFGLFMAAEIASITNFIMYKARSGSTPWILRSMKLAILQAGLFCQIRRIAWVNLLIASLTSSVHWTVSAFFVIIIEAKMNAYRITENSNSIVNLAPFGRTFLVFYIFHCFLITTWAT